jgi:hypothetical protein
MDGVRINHSAEAVWALTQAAEAVGVRVTVSTFSYGWGGQTGWSVLKAAEDHWNEGEVIVPDATGGTDPSKPLIWSIDQLSGSDASVRLVVVITDGDWSLFGDTREAARENHITEQDVYRQIFDRARQADVHTSVFGIYNCDVSSNRYGADVVANCSSVLDLPAAVEAWVREAEEAQQH